MANTFLTLKGCDSKSPLTGGWVGFFPMPREVFIVMTPNVFFRVLEDVGRDYDYGRRSIPTSKIFYSPEKFEKL